MDATGHLTVVVMIEHAPDDGGTGLDAEHVGVPRPRRRPVDTTVVGTQVANLDLLRAAAEQASEPDEAPTGDPSAVRDEPDDPVICLRLEGWRVSAPQPQRRGLQGPKRPQPEGHKQVPGRLQVGAEVERCRVLEGLEGDDANGSKRR